ncbi:hypothetical protein F511_47214 [Dorcoceras hygrometricum]|uniref:Uncharacterized protein n=1 Tax=Dorcoceras hygrometricum TaxID=472368 RepID=A0A2Z6ZSN5_9LAMI|nr:hypothetical protein F511_47214 [Dorcoceras hygrometricum]
MDLCNRSDLDFDELKTCSCVTDDLHACAGLSWKQIRLDKSWELKRCAVADQIEQEMRAEEVRCINKERNSANKKIILEASISLESISSGKFTSGNQIAIEHLK